MKAAKLAVYMARKTTANMAQTLVMNRAVNPLGESTWTAAWNSTAHTSQYVRNKENLCDADGVACMGIISIKDEVLGDKITNKIKFLG